MSENFSLDDLVIDDQDSTKKLVTGAAWLFAGLVLLFSAVTTYMFFSTYAAAVGAFIQDAALAPIVAGIIGVVLLDLGSFVWALTRSYHATTGEQMAVALAASGIAFALSLLTSALYVVLSSSFSVGVYDAAGNLTRLGQYLQYAGVGVVTLALIANFSALYLYLNKAHATKAATQRTSMRAIVTAGRHKADRARAELVTQRTLREIMHALPGLADEIATANRGDYFSRTLGNGRPAEQLTAEQLTAEQLNAILARLGYADAVSGQPAQGDQGGAMGFPHALNLLDLARANATQRGDLDPLAVDRRARREER